MVKDSLIHISMRVSGNTGSRDLNEAPEHKPFCAPRTRHLQVGYALLFFLLRTAPRPCVMTKRAFKEQLTRSSNMPAQNSTTKQQSTSCCNSKCGQGDRCLVETASASPVLRSTLQQKSRHSLAVREWPSGPKWLGSMSAKY